MVYGAFAPRADGYNFPERRLIDRDFHLMAGAGINTVRTYTTPPLDLLDLAGEHGLRVMAGLAWSQHVAFLDDRHLRRTIRREIGARARDIADHPALLLTALGNEIPRRLFAGTAGAASSASSPSCSTRPGTAPRTCC